MQRVQCHEGLVDRGSVLVPQLRKVVLRELTVDAILVRPVSAGGEVRADCFGAAEVGETQADDLEGVIDAPLLRLRVRGVKVVAALDLVVEQRKVAVQGLFVELLLVQRPSQLVEGELVVLRAAPAIGDRSRVSALRLIDISSG